MTEQEWLTSTDPGAMLQHIARKASDRKLRLFLVGCCQSMWDALRASSKKADIARWHRLVRKQYAEWQDDDPIRALAAAEHAVGVAERYADGKAPLDELERARDATEVAYSAADGMCEAVVNERLPETGRARVRREYAATFLTSAVVRTKLKGFLGRDSLPDSTAEPSDLAHWADLLRDVFGNPFRKAKFLARHGTSTVVALAQQIYQAKDFSTMPILADALQDAGCDNEAILNHCRDEKQVHVPGCWVLDGVLGKS